MKRIVTALMPNLLFRCFSLFLPHLRTLARDKRSQNCLRFGTGGPSLCLYPLLSRNIIFFPALTMAARAKKKIGRSDLLTLSACTIGILSTLTYTEFDCAALLAMLQYQFVFTKAIFCCYFIQASTGFMTFKRCIGIDTVHRSQRSLKKTKNSRNFYSLCGLKRMAFN